MKLFGKQRRIHQERWNPEYDDLATYNTEVARGLVHTPEWKERMRKLQNEYNRKYLRGEN